MKNKAHTATLNRICRRYNVSPGNKHDIQTDSMIIEVETSATVGESIERLRGIQSAAAYIAVTNKEGIKLALSLAKGTHVGVMDPKGEILLAAAPLHRDQPFIAPTVDYQVEVQQSVHE